MPARRVKPLRPPFYPQFAYGRATSAPIPFASPPMPQRGLSQQQIMEASKQFTETRSESQYRNFSSPPSQANGSQPQSQPYSPMIAMGMHMRDFPRRTTTRDGEIIVRIPFDGWAVAGPPPPDRYRSFFSNLVHPWPAEGRERFRIDGLCRRAWRLFHVARSFFLFSSRLDQLVARVANPTAHASFNSSQLATQFAENTHMSQALNDSEDNHDLTIWALQEWPFRVLYALAEMYYTSWSLIKHRRHAFLFPSEAQKTSTFAKSKFQSGSISQSTRRQCRPPPIYDRYPQFTSNNNRDSKDGAQSHRQIYCN